MSFTTTHAIMLGVAAIGGFAVYKMAKASNAPEPTPEGAPTQLTPSNLAMLGDPLHLTQRRFYRGRLRLPAIGVPPFVASASASDLQQALTALGFSGVRVYSSIQELPQGWPQSTMTNIAAGTRFFEGTWPLPTADMPRPAQIEAMWVSIPPKAPVVSGMPVG